MKQHRYLLILIMAVVMMAMNTTKAWADDESATQVTAENYTTLGLTSDYVGYYAIQNASQLYWFAENASGKSAVLTADIVVNQNVLNDDLSLKGDVSNLRMWTPIELSSGKTFDGQGHTVSGLYYIDEKEQTFVGLVGRNYGTIKNVGVKDLYFENKNSAFPQTSGVCGFNSGTITNCYATNVSVSGYDAGGVCGDNSGTITNCYATNVAVTGNHNGGVCGENIGTITNCYTDHETPINGNNGNTNVVAVETKSSEAFASGEVCWLLNGKIVDGTWTAGTGTPTWYQKLSTDATPGLVKDGTSNTVYYGYNGACSQHYYNNSNGTNDTQGGHEYVNGTCKWCGAYEPATAVTAQNYASLGFTAENYSPYVGYYAIQNAGQLYWFAANAEDKSAVLTADIVVNESVLNADLSLKGDGSNLRMWTPITLSEGKTFDGNGHTVSGLYYIGEKMKDQAGLVGINNGTIQNVGVKDSYFENNVNSSCIDIAGVCGLNNSTIINCYATNVSATGYETGGVCGNNHGGTITNCYAANVSVSGCYASGVCGYNTGNITNCYAANVSVKGSYVGGVCGYNRYGTITNCYATNVSVTGGYVGGVCGYNEGSITNCYATNVAVPSYDSGGVCGENFNGTITNCYTDHKDPIGNYTTTSIATAVSTKTSEAFASGEVCWLLNGKIVDGIWTAGTGTPTWYQKLSTDAAPVLVKDGTGNTVYYGYNGACSQHYYNNSNGANDTKGDHLYENFTCKLCNDAPLSFASGTLQDKVAYLRTSGLTVTDFTYTRQFEGTNWTTWYVPFNLTLTDDICAKYSFSSINNVHQYDDNDDDVADHTVIECSLLSKGTTLKANYPYLVRARTDADKAMTITLQNVTLAYAEAKSIDCQSVDEKYTFTGTYTSIDDEGVKDPYQYSLFDNEQDGWKLFSSLCPQRHYLTITSRSSNTTVIAVGNMELKVSGEESVSPGDLNSDGKITIADLAILIQLLNSGNTITNSAADVDNDGFVDMHDIELLKTRLLQGPAAQ